MVIGNWNQWTVKDKHVTHSVYRCKLMMIQGLQLSTILTSDLWHLLMQWVDCISDCYCAQVLCASPNQPKASKKSVKTHESAKLIKIIHYPQPFQPRSHCAWMKEVTISQVVKTRPTKASLMCSCLISGDWRSTLNVHEAHAYDRNRKSRATNFGYSNQV